MKKQISTLAGIIIIIIAIIILFGGVFAYSYFAKPSAPSKNIYVKTNSDPACDGAKDPDYILGFGIEHTYEGDIKPGMHVKIVLSCDHKKFTISGAVNQIITSADLKKYNNGEEVELADLVGGENIVDLNSDYNFDGYNDLSSIMSNGQGISGEKSFFIFIYDSRLNKFVYNDNVSSLTNVGAVKEKSEISQTSCFFSSDEKNSITCDITYYKWASGHLQKASTDHTVNPLSD